jgi:cytochrome c biogenesis protein CcmG/thiol:disulfide interchange protein DsbE
MHILPLKSRLGLACALAGMAATLNFNLQAAGFKAGDDLPDLATLKLEGTLPNDLKGKVVLLDFWASWCEPCKASFPAMAELQKKYGAQGLVVVAVNVDEKRADMESFLKQNAASFAVVRDAAQQLVAQAGIATMPSSFLIDQAGKVRFVHAGFRGEESRKKYQQEIESLLKK